MNTTRVTVRAVNINSFGSNRRVPNDDGIDLVESRFVHISGGPLVGKATAAIVLKDGAGVSIRNCQAADGTGVFLSHSGVTDARAFLNNDLTRAQRVCEPAMLNFQITR